MNQSDKLARAIKIFKESGGILRMSEATRLGIHRRDLQRLCEQGQLDRISRGLYRLKDMPTPSLPDFIPVAKKISSGVICLISALAFHELTTQIPHFVYVAIPHNAHKPSIDYPPIRFFWFREKSLTTGVEKHTIDGCVFKIFDKEKTLVDVVKYRNKIGMDITVEALRMYWDSGQTDLNKLYAYAKKFHVEKTLRPLMEAITHG